MDIISEILDIDRLAEEQLENARAERLRLLSDCEAQIAAIGEEARKKIEEHKADASETAEKSAAQRLRELDESGKAETERLLRSYEENHEKWEREILDALGL